jgi:hypothetical protein
MAGRHVDDEPFALTSGHSLERFGHSFVVTARNEGRPDLFHELDEPRLAKLTVFELLQLG